MSNATIVALTSRSKNARGAFFEDHTIINVVPQGKFFCLLFAPRHNTWRCYKINKMPNCVNIFVRTMLHSHLRPQRSKVCVMAQDILGYFGQCHVLRYFWILLAISWLRIFWDTLGNVMSQDIFGYFWQYHGLGYFGILGILLAMSCPRIFLDTFGNIMAQDILGYLGYFQQCHVLGYFWILLAISWLRIFWDTWDTFGNVMSQDILGYFWQYHGLGYFWILLAISWPRIFWDQYGSGL